MEKFRIMLVEDDEDTQQIIGAFLQPEFEVCLANNGMDALTKIDHIQPDLIISDVMMPIMDGRTFVSNLRKRPSFIDLPVIFLSALTGREDIVEGYDVGANLYLTKPIEPRRLMRNVEQMLKDKVESPRPKKLTVDEYEKWLKSRMMTTAPQAPSSAAEKEIEKTAEREKTVTNISLKKVRVLIVDDDPDIQHIISVPLINECQVICAGNGLTALEMAVKYKPDIFIIDWMMPRMTGYQLCQMIKKSAEFSAAPIIFISAKSTPKDHELVRKLGVYKFLPKPFKANDVIRLLEEIVKRPNFHVRTDRPPYKEVMKREQIKHNVNWQG